MVKRMDGWMDGWIDLLLVLEGRGRRRRVEMGGGVLHICYFSLEDEMKWKMENEKSSVVVMYTIYWYGVWLHI